VYNAAPPHQPPPVNCPRKPCSPTTPGTPRALRPGTSHESPEQNRTERLQGSFEKGSTHPVRLHLYSAKMAHAASMTFAAVDNVYALPSENRPWIQDVTQRLPGKVACIINNRARPSLEFKPERYAATQWFAPKTRLPPSNGYAGHRPGAKFYDLGMSHGAYSRSAKEAPRQATPPTPRMLPKLRLANKVPPVSTTSGPSFYNQTPITKCTISEPFKQMPCSTDQMIVNQNDHWFGTVNGFTRKEDGTVWRAHNRTHLAFDQQLVHNEDLLR